MSKKTFYWFSQEDGYFTSKTPFVSEREGLISLSEKEYKQQNNCPFREDTLEEKCQRNGTQRSPFGMWS